MTIRRDSHAIYDTRYHLVWVPKYRNWISRGDIRNFIEKCFQEIAIANDIDIEAMEIAEDHVRIFLAFSPMHTISQVVQRLKGQSAREIFLMFPEVKNELWGGEFWEDGYFIRTVGNKVTKEIIKKYIEYHKHKKNTSTIRNLLKAPPFKAGIFYC